MPKFKLQVYGPTLYCKADTEEEAEEVFNSMCETDYTGFVLDGVTFGDVEEDDTIPDEWVEA